MTALTKNVSRAYRDGAVSIFPVKAGAKINQGGIVGIDGGYAIAATSGGDKYYPGLALEGADNSASGAVDGAVSVMVRTTGAFKMASKANDVPAIGAPAYLDDDQTVRKTPGGGTKLGVVIGKDSGTTPDVWVLYVPVF